MRLLKIVGSFVLVLLPIIFVVGIIRVGWLGYPVGTYTLVDSNGDGVYEAIQFSENYGSFLPSADEFISMFTSFPSFEEYFADAITFWNDNVFYWSQVDVVDIGSFFEWVGGLAVAIYALLYMAVSAITYPVAVLTFIFGNVFTPYHA